MADKKNLKESAKSLNEKRRKFTKEFREFALKGNAMNLAIGVIIGAAFQGLINSVVNDLINPLIGIIFKTDFSNLYIPLFSTETNETYLTLADSSLKTVRDAGLPVFAYGNFISTLINFFLMAFVVFMLLKVITSITNHLSKKEEVVETAPTTKKCPFCLEEVAIKATRCPHCTSQFEAE